MWDYDDKIFTTSIFFTQFQIPFLIYIFCHTHNISLFFCLEILFLEIVWNGRALNWFFYCFLFKLILHSFDALL